MAIQNIDRNSTESWQSFHQKIDFLRIFHLLSNGSLHSQDAFGKSFGVKTEKL